jgi:outer membrane protein assembly factor BamD (BamD/ComL family)
MKNTHKKTIWFGRYFNFLVLCILGLGLAACASGKPEGELTGTVSSLYNEALAKMQAGQYAQAVHGFEELERQYPYS